MHSAIPILVAIFAIWWVNREPKFDWTPAAPITNYVECPANSKGKLLLFGGTSMLGRYIVDTWREQGPDICIINYSRKQCSKCQVNINADMRDTLHIERILDHYKPDTVLTSTKPPMLLTHYRAYIEINVASIIEITRLSKKYGVKNFIHVSSIAASSHFVQHVLTDEKAPQPLYTQYEAAYDISKRLGEDYVLSQHEPGKFNTIALRVSGIIGGEGDPYFHHRWFPFILTFNNPIVVDYGFAGNIADALFAVFKGLRANPNLGGQFYYYTGEHILENATAVALAESTGKPLLSLPHWMLTPMLELWQWIRWDHNTYTIMDLMRCANVEQTFDQTKFHSAFPDFKPKYTILEALNYLYGKKK